MTSLPHFAKGEVIKGFGRGSKELGCPTANLPLEVVKALPEGLETGVYFGLAQIEGTAEVYKMVASLGWNPYYQNTEKSLEAHLIHKFQADFYGRVLKVVLLGYLRPEQNFNSLDDLIQAINGDIEQAKQKLDQSAYAHYKGDKFFKT